VHNNVLNTSQTTADRHSSQHHNNMLYTDKQTVRQINTQTAQNVQVNL